MTVYVLVKCISCGNEREVYAGEIPEGQQPMCNKCGMIMVAKQATVTQKGRK